MWMLGVGGVMAVHEQGLLVNGLGKQSPLDHMQTPLVAGCKSQRSRSNSYQTRKTVICAV